MKAAWLAVLLCIATSQLIAHHSVVAIYDSEKPIELTGRVAKIDWINPHSLLSLEVTDGANKGMTWVCEMGSPNVLAKNGLSKVSLKVGDSATIKGATARDGSPALRAITLTMTDGKRVFNAERLGEPETNP